jgi:hypothetical protein
LAAVGILWQRWPFVLGALLFALPLAWYLTLVPPWWFNLWGWLILAGLALATWAVWRGKNRLAVIGTLPGWAFLLWLALPFHGGEKDSQPATPRASLAAPTHLTGAPSLGRIPSQRR